MNTRPLAVSGLFYPDEGGQIRRFLERCDTAAPTIPTFDPPPSAIIVPHAGYIYSGYTANLAYRACRPPKRVVVIGPSHRVYLKGASCAPFDIFPTPCGDLSIDTAFSDELKHSFSWLHSTPKAHQEHSTEVQMPLIAHHFPATSVVEIVYGELEDTALASLVSFCLEVPGTLMVISTDLSHFHPLDKAKTLDKRCIDAIASLDLNGFSACEACGLAGVRAMVHVALAKKLSPCYLDYRTSHDHNHDTSSVVGYTAFAFNKQASNSNGL